MDILPANLKEIAYNCTYKKGTVAFHLKCTCGSKAFKIMKGKTHEGKQREEKWNIYWKKYRFVPIFSLGDAIERKSGKRYWYGSTFFGVRVGKYYQDISDCVQDLCVVKAVCPNCSKEFILFDNRKHGYEALAYISDEQEFGKIMPLADEKNLKFRNVCRGKEGAITIAIQNNLTLDDFYETFGENALDELYSMAFSWIKIIAMIDNKKHVVLDEETS